MCFLFCKMKIYAFIDSQNLNLAVQSCGWKLDLRKFYVYLHEKYMADKIFLFLGYLEANKHFYNILKSIGYVIIFKPTVESRGRVIKGNCDAELVLHCMIEFGNFDKAIIVSGDGDFYCLVEYLKEQNKLFKLGIPNKSRFSSLLREFNSFHFYISLLRQLLEYKKERHNDWDRPLS